jgi:regulator of sigma E protease
MLETMIADADMQTGLVLAGALSSLKNYLLIFAGFSVVIFVHELGHFLAAKWCDVRVHKFAVGFGRAIFAWRRGIGLRWGSTEPEYRQRLKERVYQFRKEDQQMGDIEPTDAEIARAAEELKLGETEYCFNWLPLGGYVKMLGQEDFAVDKSDELRVKEDPRAFTHKPIGQRMVIVSAGVVMNLAFAAFVFMLVFLIGLKSPSAEVGHVQAGMPAWYAGLQPGDLITQINGQKISDRSDLTAAIVLSDPDEPLEIVYERKDPATGEVQEKRVTINAQMVPDQNVLKIGVAPPLTNEVALTLNDPALPEDQQLKPGDRIVAVDGRPVTNFWDINALVSDLRGEWAELTIERPSTEEGGQPQTLTVPRRAHMYFVPTGKYDQESGHLLGLVPRRRVAEVENPDAPPEASLRRNDVIVRWGGIVAPRLDEIKKSIVESRGGEIPVVVVRDGKEQTIRVRPDVSGWFAKGKPRLGVDLMAQENDRVVIADIVSQVTQEIPTPAASLKDQIPRGAVLTRLNDEPVKNWYELTRRFLELAGTDVKVTWQSEGLPEQSGTLHVPETIGTQFDLPASNSIISLKDAAGKEIPNKEVELNGRTEVLGPDNWIGLREMLKPHIGQTVTVTYSGYADPKPRTAEVKVTEEMLDTWTKRLIYAVDDVVTQIQTTTVRETNPIKAMWIGIRKTWYFIEQVYLTMHRMIFSRSMSMDQVSGPVGIFKMGSEFAAAGTPVLLYFLALISANLAVINFLPLPIVDGGLFVFLLIEKIKGSPISLRVQVATQVIGLVLIIGIFVYVTIQDLWKLFA